MKAEKTSPLFERGLAAVTKGQREEAYGFFRQVVELEHDNEEAWLWLAAITSDLDEAFAAIRNALVLNPESEKAKHALAWARTKQRLNEEAADPITPAPKAETSHARPARLLTPSKLEPASSGNKAAAAGTQPKANGQRLFVTVGLAVFIIIAAIIVYVAYSYGWFEVVASPGALVVGANRSPTAEAPAPLVATALAEPGATPSPLDQAVSDGLAAYRDGRYDQAIASLRVAIGLSPDDLLAHYDLGLALLATGRSADLERAVVEFQTAVEIAPKWAGGYSALGEALRREGLLEEALIQGRQGVNLDPLVPEHWIWLGKTYEDKGLAEEAHNCYERAAEIQKLRDTQR
jgi:tetratricopeptide (TPR) repeat protein